MSLRPKNSYLLSLLDEFCASLLYGISDVPELFFLECLQWTWNQQDDFVEHLYKDFLKG